MKTVIITGAGSGLGHAMAKKLAPLYRVILCGRNQDKLEGSLGKIDQTHQPLVFKLDVSSEKDLLSLSTFFKNDDSLYGVIANHGVGGENHFGSGDRFDEIIGTNLKGTYQFVETLIPHLKNSKHEFKNILCTSSILAQIGVPKYTAYCASKSAVLGLTRAWASELASEKILVNSICPGWVDTAMAQEGMDILAQKMNRPFEDVYKEQMSFVPLGKMSQPDEVAGLVKYILSDDNKSITGQTLNINNGAFMA